MTSQATTGTALSEHEAKQLLARHGVAVNREILVRDPDAAVAAADALGYPVAAKLCGSAFLHKTELDAVRLGLADAAAVARATTDLLARLPPPAETAPADDTGVLVAEMVRGRRELIAGIATDPHFGRTIMFGVGGIFAEVLADVAFRVLPVTDQDLADMIDELRHADLLGPFRGEPAVDRDALVASLRGLAACAEADPSITAIDVNPLIVADGRPVAVDALVTFA